MENVGLHMKPVKQRQKKIKPQSANCVRRVISYDKFHAVDSEYYQAEVSTNRTGTRNLSGTENLDSRNDKTLLPRTSSGVTQANQESVSNVSSVKPFLATV